MRPQLIDKADRRGLSISGLRPKNRKRDFLRTMTPALLTDGLRIEGGI
jgi:hypothetical protein